MQEGLGNGVSWGQEAQLKTPSSVGGEVAGLGQHGGWSEEHGSCLCGSLDLVLLSTLENKKAMDG